MVSIGRFIEKELIGLVHHICFSRYCEWFFFLQWWASLLSSYLLISHIWTMVPWVRSEKVFIYWPFNSHALHGKLHYGFDGIFWKIISCNYREVAIKRIETGLIEHWIGDKLGTCEQREPVRASSRFSGSFINRILAANYVWGRRPLMMTVSAKIMQTNGQHKGCQ